jgi:hypothetical protein
LGEAWQWGVSYKASRVLHLLATAGSRGPSACEWPGSCALSPAAACTACTSPDGTGSGPGARAANYPQEPLAVERTGRAPSSCYTRARSKDEAAGLLRPPGPRPRPAHPITPQPPPHAVSRAARTATRTAARLHAARLTRCRRRHRCCPGRRRRCSPSPLGAVPRQRSARLHCRRGRRPPQPPPPLHAVSR